MGSIDIEERITQRGKEVTIAISGSFDINVNEEFGSVTQQLTGNICELTIDFFKTRYFGLSAFSMLLPLKDFAVKNQLIPVLSNCNPTIKASLFDAGFDRNFRIT